MSTIVDRYIVVEDINRSKWDVRRKGILVACYGTKQDAIDMTNALNDVWDKYTGLHIDAVEGLRGTPND